MTSISVIIPVKNEVLKIRACIEGILFQNVEVDEIIVIDSGSTDGTIEILNEYPKVKLIQIPGEEFNHGDTRNLGVKNAKGDYLLFTVGDARAYDNKWIEKMLAGFIDEEVVAVCGKQVVPHEKDKNPLDWYKPRQKGEIVKYKYATGEFNNLTPEEKKQVCGWDDVTAMYKTEILKIIPFRRTSYSEDAIWARDALSEGHGIVYNPEAMVYHYHYETPDFTFKRALTTFYFRYKYFGYIYPDVKRKLFSKLRDVYYIWKNAELSFNEKVKWLKYNIDNNVAIERAHKLFKDTLSKNEKELDELHNKYCGKPPIPSKQ